ncbi:MAG TPA: dual specificity protein phosphatase family protein [Candidatus Binataceae bacterium]|nr:dual specificity protein phosphatase family protein [Candidatus Binataceae bacterium]
MDWFSPTPHGHIRPARHGGRPSVSEIADDLLIGEYPAHGDAQWLKLEHRVTAVHNLQDERDLSLNGIDLEALRAEYEKHAIRFVHTPIQDGSEDAVRDRLDVALTELHRLIGPGERVYLHCNAGMNRAPTIAIAYLRAYRKMSLDEAMALVKRRRACGPFMAMLEDYFGPRDYKPES